MALMCMHVSLSSSNGIFPQDKWTSMYKAQQKMAFLGERKFATLYKARDNNTNQIVFVSSQLWPTLLSIHTTHWEATESGATASLPRSTPTLPSGPISFCKAKAHSTEISFLHISNKFSEITNNYPASFRIIWLYTEYKTSLLVLKAWEFMNPSLFLTDSYLSKMRAENYFQIQKACIKFF